MSDTTYAFRDHLDVGEHVGTIYSAIYEAARLDPDRFDKEKLETALGYLWNYTYNPWLIELPNGERLMVPASCPVGYNGWYDFDKKQAQETTT